MSSLTIAQPPFQGVIPPDQQGKYTITFATDGTFSATADCNTVKGGYTIADPAAPSGDLTLTIGPSTLMMCADGSYSDLYIAALSRVTSFAIANNSLTLGLADKGTIGYAPIAK